MTDGVLDLLTAILVLGIVVAIAFSFIVPLVDTEYMDFDNQYYDKAELNPIIDYGDPEKNDTLTKRMYTYEELMLLLSIQDDHLPNPRVINLRNLITNEDLSYSGYMGTSGDGKNNGQVNLNNLYNTKYATYLSDEVFHTLIRYGGNNMTPEGYSERANVQYLPADANFGAFFIDGKFKYNAKYMLNELNGAEIPDRVSSTLTAAISYRYSETTNTRLYQFEEILRPEDGTAYENKQIYYISYHFAVPNNSPTVAGKVARLQRNDDETDSFFVEIEGNFPRKKTMQYVDTWAEYQRYLSEIRAGIN